MHFEYAPSQTRDSALSFTMNANCAAAPKPSKLAIVLATLLLVTIHGEARLSASTPSPPWTWWEAESPHSTNFPDQNPFAPADENAAKALSGRKWIGAAHPGKSLFLQYNVTISTTANYRFFARKYWSHGPFRWRFDDQPWRDCGRDVALLDDVSLAQFVNVNWVELGSIKLSATAHVLRIELPADTDAVAFDAFLLTSGVFVPRGKLKPGERYDSAPEGWFPFEPDFDPFGPAALDLRPLNEAFAGEGGFIQAKGDAFVHEKTGQPVRFWANNLGFEILNNDGIALDRVARHLAKIGVNMVRLQGPLWRGEDLTTIDEGKLAKLHRLVAALKREGIYLALSTYWPAWVRPKGVPGFEGFDGDRDTLGLPFFNQRFQELQRTVWRTILTATNPYTGMTLLQDPTLALFEILNEDGLLFWTFTPYEHVPAPQMEIIERQFGQWLTTKYGGIDKSFTKWRGGNAYQRWSGGRIKGDDPQSGRVGLLPLFEIVKRRDLRAQDTAEFLAVLQRRYYDEMYTYLKRDLGFKGSVTGSNWITANARLLGPLDKWSNTGCDFMDRHGYYGGPHEGPRAGYLLSKGDRYNDASALLFETGKPGELSFELPIMDLAYNGKPSVVSELNWPPPNRYRADMTVLAAAYGSLQGSDAFVFFTNADIEGPQELTKFSTSDPAVMGQYPATALIFRKGLVKTAPAVIHVEPRLSDLFALKGIPIAAPHNLDEYRKKDVPAEQQTESQEAGSIDPLAFLAGRVEVDITKTGGAAKILDLSRLVDRQRKTVRSVTGELQWDYGNGLATIDAPAAQGATGFLSKVGAITLQDVTIDSRMDYGSILLVSLDERPLKTSRKMLLQIMSEDNNFGWSAPGKGLRPIVDIGSPPVVVKKFEGTVSLKRADASALMVDALDFLGYKQTRLKFPQGESKFNLLPGTIYYIIGR